MIPENLEPGACQVFRDRSEAQRAAGLGAVRSGSAEVLLPKEPGLEVQHQVADPRGNSGHATLIWTPQPHL